MIKTRLTDIVSKTFTGYDGRLGAHYGRFIVTNEGTAGGEGRVSGEWGEGGEWGKRMGGGRRRGVRSEGGRRKGKR